jgi:hypothetical protein
MRVYRLRSNAHGQQTRQNGLYPAPDTCRRDTRSHGRYLVDPRIDLCSKSLALPNVYALILSKLLFTRMGFPRLGVAVYPMTGHDLT